MELSGKTAIVTGASSGNGASTVRKLREGVFGSQPGHAASSGTTPILRSSYVASKFAVRGFA